MTWQIQSWPTPEIFIRRREKPVLLDECANRYTLVSCTVPSPLSRTVADAGAGIYSLHSVDTTYQPPTPVTRTVTDAGTGGYSLDSVLIPTPVTETQTDGAAGDYSLLSCLVPTAVSRSETERPTGHYSLYSVSV